MFAKSKDKRLNVHIWAPASGWLSKDGCFLKGHRCYHSEIISVNIALISQMSSILLAKAQYPSDLKNSLRLLNEFNHVWLLICTKELFFFKGVPFSGLYILNRWI